jgi:hypothetical protein
MSAKYFRHLGTFLLHFRCSLPVFLTPFLGETLFFSKNYFGDPTFKSSEVSKSKISMSTMAKSDIRLQHWSVAKKCIFSRCDVLALCKNSSFKNKLQ